MEEELYISFLQKKRSGTLTAAEQSELDDWLAQSPDNQLVARQVEQAWELSGGFSQEVALDANADFERLARRIAAAELGPAGKVVAMRPKRNWLAIAAAVLLLVAAPLVLRKYLGNGSAMETVATNELAAPKPIELPDGSKVWLNRQSTLRHFTKNSEGERQIELSGEAFFEVAKDPKRPFVVKTALGEVTVLGTSFNVSTDGSTALEVNVSTGKVRLQPNNSSEHILLVANETGVFDQNKNSLVKSGGAANNTAAWHTQKLVFDNTTLESALAQISALHKVGLSVENEAMLRCPLTVTFDKVPLETILETLQALFGAKVEKLDSGEYRLKGGRCG